MEIIENHWKSCFFGSNNSDRNINRTTSSTYYYNYYYNYYYPYNQAFHCDNFELIWILNTTSDTLLAVSFDSTNSFRRCRKWTCIFWNEVSPISPINSQILVFTAGSSFLISSDLPSPVYWPETSPSGELRLELQIFPALPTSSLFLSCACDRCCLGN